MKKISSIGDSISRPIMDTRTSKTLVADHHYFYKEGYRDAAYEALLVCVENNRPIPAWLHPELEVIAKEELKQKKRRPRARGPRTHYLQPFCNKMIHETICAAVLLAKDKGHSHHDALYWAHRVLDEEKIQRTVAGVEKVYTLGSVETIYKEVMRDIKHGEVRYRWDNVQLFAAVLRGSLDRLLATEGD